MPILIVLVSMLLAGTPTSPPSDLARLGWLSGCWESRVGDRVTFEMWSPPDGDLMVGASRSTVAGVATAFEALRIREVSGGRIVYTAIPSGQVETDFTATFVSGEQLVVENPDHDFPTRITYRLRTGGMIEVFVEGPGGSDGPSGFRIEFARVECTSRP